MHCFWKLLNFQIYDTENLSHWSTRQIHYREHWQCTAATLLKSSLNRLQPWPGACLQKGQELRLLQPLNFAVWARKCTNAMYCYSDGKAAVVYTAPHLETWLHLGILCSQRGLDLQDVSFKNSAHFLGVWQAFSCRQST